MEEVEFWEMREGGFELVCDRCGEERLVGGFEFE